MQFTQSKNIFKKASWFLLGTIFLTILATVITYSINPNLDEIVQSISEQVSDDIKETEGLGKVWKFIVNNGFFVPFQMLLLAIIPIPFLYFINLITSAVLPGVLFGVALQADSAKGISIILSVIPYYIFEFFGFCLFAVMLMELNKTIRTKIKNAFSNHKKETHFTRTFIQTIQVYAFYVLPFMIVAAFFETYVADMLFNLLQK